MLAFRSGRHSLPRARGRFGVGAGPMGGHVQGRPHPGLPPQAGEGDKRVPADQQDRPRRSPPRMSGCTPSPARGGGLGWGQWGGHVQRRPHPGLPPQAGEGDKQTALPPLRAGEGWGGGQIQWRGHVQRRPHPGLPPQAGEGDKRTALPPPRAGEGWGGADPMGWACPTAPPSRPSPACGGRRQANGTPSPARGGGLGWGQWGGHVQRRPHPGLPPQAGEGDKQTALPPARVGEGWGGSNGAGMSNGASSRLPPAGGGRRQTSICRQRVSAAGGILPA